MSKSAVDPMTEHLVTLRWMREGTAFVVGLVDKLPDDEFREPSGLPNWSRAHVVAHLARNAEAIGRLARWARTGVETPMYLSYQQRNLDIELSVRQPVETLRAELTDTAAALAREVSQLNEGGWASTVRTAQGALVPATVIPWMRSHEVWLHGVDLAAGAGCDALPADLVDTLLGYLASSMAARDDCPGALLSPTDRDYTRVLRPAAEAPTVRGAAADLLAYLSGRPTCAELTASSTTGPTALPTIPRWL